LYRILRALENTLILRSEISPIPARASRGPALEFAIVVLRLRRDALRARIAQRVRDMFERGLVAEAHAVREIAADAPALSGLGYAEALAMLDGLATQGEALASTIHRTQRYAKRQETWFRRMRAAVIVDAEDADAATRAIIALARERLAHA
jgi:tRNA dimethylallyltransferase